MKIILFGLIICEIVILFFRESQSKWFGKRGLNWHISVATSRPANEEANQTDLFFHTIIHLFDNATQDAQTSNSILEDTLDIIKTASPQITHAYVRSDNAGCFHGHLCISCIPQINQRSEIQVKRLGFADPQGGKSICDRRAAHLKSAVRKYVNEGNDVRTAEEFIQAVIRARCKPFLLYLLHPNKEATHLT